MTSQTGRLAPGAVTAASAYTPRERKLILTFAIIGALIESMELNLSASRCAIWRAPSR